MLSRWSSGSEWDIEEGNSGVAEEFVNNCARLVEEAKAPELIRAIIAKREYIFKGSADEGGNRNGRYSYVIKR